jgi:hypothetical protein
MSDLTLKEKTSCAAHQAVTEEAEKHFYDLNQPHYPLGFSVGYRNPGHWDIYADRCPGKASAFMAANPGGFTSEKDRGLERAFRIRGEPGRVSVYDERWNPNRSRQARDDLTFRTVSAAMLWISEELMQEPALASFQ